MDDKEIIALFLARDEGAIQAAQRQYGATAPPSPTASWTTGARRRNVSTTRG